MITTYKLWDEFGPTQVVTTDLSDILTISRVYGDCAQGNSLNNGFIFPTRDGRGQRRRNDVQSHTRQPDVQLVKNGTPTMIASGQDSVVHRADACIGSEIRHSARAPNKTAILVIIVLWCLPFLGDECLSEGITKARSLYYAILVPHT